MLRRVPGGFRGGYSSARSHQRTGSERGEGEGEEDFADVRVPEEFGETHADGFEGAAGGDDDTDGHGGGGGNWRFLGLQVPKVELRASPRKAG